MSCDKTHVTNPCDKMTRQCDRLHESPQDVKRERDILSGNLSYVPVAITDLLVCRHVVANQRQDHHDYVLRHTDHIGACRHMRIIPVSKCQVPSQ